jgi:two-component system NtrC family sensor kinase
MASAGQLAAGVAHKMNNSIGFVSSNLDSLNQYTDTYRQLCSQVLELVASDPPEAQDASKQTRLKFVHNEGAKELLNESIDGLKRVNELVRNIKQFSCIDSDEKQWFDINDCVTTTLNMVSNKLKYHCNVEKNFSALPKVLINVGKISQILTNLLINAGQAISKNRHIKITSKQQENNVVVSIINNGIGIYSANLNKLFAFFFITKRRSGHGFSTFYFLRYYLRT